MKVGFLFLNGFDILNAVQKLRTVFAEIVSNEIANENFKKESYSLNLTFNELLNGTWNIEWFKRENDADNTKRFRLNWYYALEDKNANTKYNDGNLAHKYIAEYLVVFVEDKEEVKEENKEEVNIITKEENKTDIEESK